MVRCLCVCVSRNCLLSSSHLYIIGAVCLSVTKRHHFPYSKDFAVSPVYSFIPYSKELVVSMFLDTFVVKGIYRFHIYRHFPNSKLSGNSKTTQVSRNMETAKSFDYKRVKKHGNDQVRNVAINLRKDQIF